MATKGRPLTSDERDAIIADIRAGQKSNRQIAKDYGINPSTVTRIAQTEGITDAFDRTQTEKATQAHAADARSRRAKLALDLLDDAQRLRDRAWSEYEMVVDNRQTGPQNITLDLPPAQDVRAFYNALSLAVDKHTRLEQYDTSDSAADAKSFLGDLAEAFGIANKHINGEPPETA